jgi:hypothetical protein
VKTFECFKDEVRARYTGASKEVTVDRDPTPNSTGNGVAYRSLYTILCCLAREQEQQDLTDFLECLELREADGPGLYHRNPGDATRNGIDDHLYAAAASCMIDSQKRAARAILNHARVHRWHFDDQNPNSLAPAAWLGRYVWFPCFLMLAAGEAPSFGDRMLLSAAMLFLPSKDDAGAILMKFVTARIGLVAGGFCAAASRRAIRKMNSLYPGGLSDAAAAYFNRKGEPPHPLSWPEVWQNIM